MSIFSDDYFLFVCYSLVQEENFNPHLTLGPTGVPVLKFGKGLLYYLSMKGLQIWYASLNMPTLQMLFYKIFQKSRRHIF